VLHNLDYYVDGVFEGTDTWIECNDTGGGAGGGGGGGFAEDGGGGAGGGGGSAPNNKSPCHLVDPFLGALDFTVKLGPEVQLGPIKVGASFYKNLMTGGTGGKLEANAALVSIQADSPTPEGGTFGGGGPGNNQYSASFLGFQYNFNTGKIEFNPSKSFTLGAQFLLGGEVSFNVDRYNQINKDNAACKAQGGH